jgi:hypothetical protein
MIRQPPTAIPKLMKKADGMIIRIRITIEASGVL